MDQGRIRILRWRSRRRGFKELRVGRMRDNIGTHDVKDPESRWELQFLDTYEFENSDWGILLFRMAGPAIAHGSAQRWGFRDLSGGWYEEF